MSNKQYNPLASYESVNDSYFKERRLKRSAGSGLLWGLGVCAVIGGDFFGWNAGLFAGGFWGMTIATVLMALMYTCIVYSIAELSVALPHTGGFYSFTRSAFGPFWGFICGIALIIEYVLSVAATVVSIGDYLQPLVPAVPVYFLWLAAYITFVAINIWGLEQTLFVSFYLALAAIFMLCIFYGTVLLSGIFKPELLFNIPAEPGQSATWLPKGWQGMFAAIPFAIWFFLAIEELPLAAEETYDIPKSMPKGLTLGIFTLIVLALLTLVLNSGVGGGALAIGQSAVPLKDGLAAYYGTYVFLNIPILVGVVCTFHGIMYAYGRIIFALSRAGYIPRWLSVTGKTDTPYRALILGAVVGFICAVLIKVVGGAVGSALIYMAVIGAVISYVLVLLSYIKLKLSSSTLPRPYESPLGLPGAVIGLALAIFALGACLLVPAYQFGVLGILVVLVLATIYFFLYGKNRLVAHAPEEKAALLMQH